MEISLSPLLIVRDCESAARFYAEAFCAVPARLRAGGDRVTFLALHIAGAPLLLVEEDLARGMTSPAALGGTASAVFVSVGDADRAFERAVAAGASVIGEPRDADWGQRWARVRCPFGHVWQLAHDLTGGHPAAKGGSGDARGQTEERELPHRDFRSTSKLSSTFGSGGLTRW